jgi:hypothetical protein
MNLRAISVDYVIVDTLREPRETFAAILETWRDGYTEPIGVPKGTREPQKTHSLAPNSGNSWSILSKDCSVNLMDLPQLPREVVKEGCL